MKLYHGASQETIADSTRPMYFTSNINEAKEYALGLDSDGNYNEHSYIYAIEIADDAVFVIEDDFEEFDCAAYNNIDTLAAITFNPESGYYLIRNPRNLSLVEDYTNTL